MIKTGVMEPVKAEVKVGDTTTVLAKQTGDLVVNTQASYVSSDESIATVDNTGKVTGIKEGNSNNYW